MYCGPNGNWACSVRVSHRRPTIKISYLACATLTILIHAECVERHFIEIVLLQIKLVPNQQRNSIVCAAIHSDVQVRVLYVQYCTVGNSYVTTVYISLRNTKK